MSTVTTEPRVQPVPTPPSPPPAPGRHWVRPLVLLGLLGLTVGLGIWRYESVPAEEPAKLVLQGNIDVRQVNLSFKVAGRIDQVNVDEGDSVKAGQVLATLETTYFEDDLRLARATRDQQKANLDRLNNGSRPEEIEVARAQEAQIQATLKRTELDYRRTVALARERALAQQDLETSLAAFRETQAQLKSAAASLRLTEIGPRKEDIAAGQAQYDAAVARVIISERNLADSKLLAPNAGIILTRARERGAIVQAGDTVFTLTLIDPVWVRTYVAEPDLGAIRPGMTATVTTDAVLGKSYRGRIGFIAPTAEFTPKTVETRELRTDLVYRLRVIVDNPDGGLRQGMPVTVALDLPGQRPKTFWQRLRQAFFFESSRK